MDVSIIIVNYNTRNITLKCIDSIYKHTSDVNFEIILVDNNSKDGSYDFFSKRDDIIYIYSNENLGFGRANNLGISKARGKYVFFLNSDTLLINNAIALFFNYLERMPSHVAGVGAYLLDINYCHIHSYGVFPTCTNQCLDVIKRKMPFQRKENIYKKEDITVEYITGADLFIRKSVLDKVGLFDSTFFMYYEETDLQYRITKAGYIFKIITQPKIIHLEGASSSGDISTPIRKLSMQLSSRYNYLRKHNPQYKYVIFRVIYALICLFPTLMFQCSWSAKRKYLKLLFCYNEKGSFFKKKASR